MTCSQKWILADSHSYWCRWRQLQLLSLPACCQHPVQFKRQDYGTHCLTSRECDTRQQLDHFLVPNLA